MKSLNPEGEVSKFIFLEYMATHKNSTMVREFDKSKL
jgi:hypothetical protein